MSQGAIQGKPKCSSPKITDIPFDLNASKEPITPPPQVPVLASPHSLKFHA